MLFLNLLTGALILYFLVFYVAELVNYEQTMAFLMQQIGNANALSAHVISTFQYPFLLTWITLFSLLFIAWLWILIRKKQALIPLLAGVVILLALIIHLTENQVLVADIPMEIGGAPVFE